MNVSVKYIRPEYKDLKEWMASPENAYIGRQGVVFIEGKRFPPTVSPFCNPYKAWKDGTREEIIAKYELYIRKKLSESKSLREEFLSLKGKCLGCWCKPEACHGDVLIKLLDSIS